jgi:hypothetical protein
MSQSVRVGDKGTEFRVTITDEDVAVDLSSATVLQLIFKKPSGETLTVDADLYTDGTDGAIYYNVVDGDLNESGVWKLQSYIEIGSTVYSSTIGTFKVECNL